MTVRTWLERPEVAAAEAQAYPLGMGAQAGAKRRCRGLPRQKASRARGSVRCDAGADPRGPRGADASAGNTEDKGRAGGQEERPPDQG